MADLTVFRGRADRVQGESGLPDGPPAFEGPPPLRRMRRGSDIRRIPRYHCTHYPLQFFITFTEIRKFDLV
jgi:hypothetical protein